VIPKCCSSEALSCSEIGIRSSRLPFCVTMNFIPDEVMRPSEVAKGQMRLRVKLESGEAW